MCQTESTTVCCPCVSAALELTGHPVRVLLNVRYPEAYPDSLPELSITHEEDTVNDEDVEKLLAGLRTVVSHSPHDSQSLDR